MRPLIALLVVLFVLAVLVHLYGVLRTLPTSEGEPAPRELTRGPVRPPDDPLTRTWNRLTVCARQGHTWRVAFPMGHLAQQCTRCAAVAPPVVVDSYRARV